VRPDFAEGGGEEAEVVGLYVIAEDGTILRVGYSLGNEYSDHAMESRNYLYLAHSKLRPSSFGPELLVGDLPGEVTGRVSIMRGEGCVWSAEFLTGETNMTHSLANLEHHHFKYGRFLRSGDVHIYFFGASVLSFGEGIEIRPGDRCRLECEVFGAPLELAFAQSGPLPVEVHQL